jgi:hypothetical protein
VALEPLPHLDIVGQGTPAPGKGSFIVQRGAHVLSVCLDGEIVDAVSDAWRACAQKTFDENGYTTFGYVDAVRAKVAQSLGARMRSAAFMRRSADRMKRIILVSADVNVSFVMRTIMRAAGVGNVTLAEPAPALLALAAMREGKDPVAEGLL